MIEQLPYWANVVIWLVPYGAMLLLGVAIALLTLPRHPWTSGLVIAGCALMFATTIGWQALSVALIELERWEAYDAWWWWGLGLATVVAQSTGYALVLAAAFVGRLRWPA